MTIAVDWNDLKYFLSVADHGSTLRAAGDLRVSQTTVARRIAALEEAVKLPLFDRRQAGYTLTPAGAALLDRARAVRVAATGFDEAAAAQARDNSGTVRLTTEDIFATALLGSWLRELYELHPKIFIEIDASPAIRDLGTGEADIALRATKSAGASGLVGRRLCRDDWTLYCSRDYAERHGVPKTVEQLRSHTLVGGGGGNLWRAYEASTSSASTSRSRCIRPRRPACCRRSARAGRGAGFGFIVFQRARSRDAPRRVRALTARSITNDTIRKTRAIAVAPA